MSRQALVGFTTLTLLFLLTPSATKAATLVGGSVYTNVYDGNWVDPLPNRAASWRLSLHAPTVMETSDLIPWPAGQPASTPNDTGNYAPTMLIRNGVVTSGPYSYTATMRTNDDDLFGIIFGYQDSSNYYRVGMRNQSPGSWGGSAGLTVQKVVAGVVTQISPAGTGAGPAVITQSMINNRTPLNVRVDVSGTNYSVFFNDELKASGSDDGLADGQIGLQSWAQNYDSGELPDTRPWGTEADSVTLVDSNGIFSENFSTRNVPWRQVIMTNATGTTNTGNVATTLEPLGNFGNAIGGPWIHQQSNGFVYATTTAPNVDFIGPAVAVDSPGATSWSDYEM
ncbi:MAG: hypothetical protein IT425_03730, partial [Pirellulales bacterium]|nr:hypothetical protein [Pirellulales bacterium]